MRTSEEIKAAMEYTPRMDTDADEDFAEMESSRDTLAACVRELYEALNDALHTDSYVCQVEATYVQRRYRDALEGGGHAEH
jgi:hypothetical protein